MNSKQYYEPPDMKRRDEDFNRFIAKHRIHDYAAHDKESYEQDWLVFRTAWDDGAAAAEQRVRELEDALMDARNALQQLAAEFRFAEHALEHADAALERRRRHE